MSLTQGILHDNQLKYQIESLMTPVIFILQMAHLASFFLTVNYALTAYMRLREKADTITNLPFSSVSTFCIRTIFFSYY